MKLPPLIYNSIGKFLVFAALEAVCLLLIVRNSTVQSSRVMEGVRTVQSFFWEKSSAIKNYTALRGTNRDLIEENAVIGLDFQINDAMGHGVGREAMIVWSDHTGNSFRFVDGMGDVYLSK